MADETAEGPIEWRVNEQAMFSLWVRSSLGGSDPATPADLLAAGFVPKAEMEAADKHVDIARAAAQAAEQQVEQLKAERDVAESLLMRFAGAHTSSDAPWAEAEAWAARRQPATGAGGSEPEGAGKCPRCNSADRAIRNTLFHRHAGSSFPCANGWHDQAAGDSPPRTPLYRVTRRGDRLWNRIGQGGKREGMLMWLAFEDETTEQVYNIQDIEPYPSAPQAGPSTPAEPEGAWVPKVGDWVRVVLSKHIHPSWHELACEVIETDVTGARVRLPDGRVVRWDNAQLEPSPPPAVLPDRPWVPVPGETIRRKYDGATGKCLKYEPSGYVRYEKPDGSLVSDHIRQVEPVEPPAVLPGGDGPFIDAFCSAEHLWVQGKTHEALGRLCTAVAKLADKLESGAKGKVER